MSRFELHVVVLCALVVGAFANMTCWECTGCGSDRSTWSTCTNARACMKFSSRVAGATVRNRACWSKAAQDSCSYGDAAGGAATTCFCNYNLCNTAHSSTLTSQTIIGFAAVLAVCLAAARLLLASL